MNQERVCQKIRELRIKKGFSQRYIGEKCGLTQQAINRIEHGLRKIDIDLLFNIASALEVDMFDDILTDTISFHSVADVDDEALTNYINSLGYKLELLDDKYYILSDKHHKYKVTHVTRANLFAEIDDYTLYKINSIINSQIKENNT